MGVVDKLLFVPRFITEGCRLAIDFPTVPEIISISAKNIVAVEGEHIRSHGPLRVFELKCRNKKQICMASVAIDVEKEEVYWYAPTDRNLFGKDSSSADIGVMIFASPALLALSPALALANWGIKYYEKESGMNRYAAVLYNKIERRVSKADKQLLKTAFAKI